MTHHRLARFTALACLALAARCGWASVDTVLLDASGTQSFTDSTGTVYSLTVTQPAGSGVFDPFARIQRTGDSQGYNSSANNGPNATLDLVNLPGSASPHLPLAFAVSPEGLVSLTLDYNEPGATGRSLINLEDLTLVVSTDPDKTGPSGPGNNQPWSIQSIPLSPGDAVVYHLGDASDTAGHSFRVQLNADDNPANGNGGSGAADLAVAVNLLNVPNINSYLDGNHYLYVYSRFSSAGAGYEEWRSLRLSDPTTGVGPPVPEPASVAVLGLGALLLLPRGRRA